jgi:hypothetical protein
MLLETLGEGEEGAEVAGGGGEQGFEGGRRGWDTLEEERRTKKIRKQKKRMIDMR